MAAAGKQVQVLLFQVRVYWEPQGCCRMEAPHTHMYELQYGCDNGLFVLKAALLTQRIGQEVHEGAMLVGKFQTQRPDINTVHSAGKLLILATPFNKLRSTKRGLKHYWGNSSGCGVAHHAHAGVNAI